LSPDAPFLHESANFKVLIESIAEERDISPSLAEKDYWIMHALWGLKRQGFTFELKGGTSLSKGYGIINRFSEDLDIQIEPPEGMKVYTGKNQDKKEAHIESRRKFFEWFSKKVLIPDMTIEEAPKILDKAKGAEIILNYRALFEPVPGQKSGVLLELGFDTTAPNQAKDISSWAYERALKSDGDYADNRAMGILCYNPEYTFVEKLQTSSKNIWKTALCHGTS